MTKLHEVALTCGVKRNNTSKLFWGIYGYCVKASIPTKFTDQRRKATHNFWKKVRNGQKWGEVRPTLGSINRTYKDQVQALSRAIVAEFSGVLPEGSSYYCLPSDANLTFYFTSAEQTEAVIASCPKVFHSYCAPASAAVEKRLHEVAGRKVEVRQQGYYREFPYRITFNWQEDYTPLDQRVLALQFEDSLFSQGDRRTLYVKSEDDFFLAKLGLSDCIESVSECITIDEVENQSV